MARGKTTEKHGSTKNGTNLGFEQKLVAGYGQATPKCGRGRL